MLPVASRIIRQPAPAAYPAETETSMYELEMFAVFRSETVYRLGTFNRDFWATDVPRAAQAYPALWHASLALAAVQQRITVPVDEGGPEEGTALAISGRHYVFALNQFNKSIACVAERLKQATPLTYADQEMVLLTNVLYVAICNILGDIKQAISHVKNVTELIGQFRFGEGVNAQKHSGGMLRYPEFLALLAYIDGQSGDFDEITERFDREYVISVPSYDSFSTMTEAYLAFLVIMYDGLKPINYADHYTYEARISILTGKVEDYKIRLADYEYRKLKLGLSKADIKCIAELRLYLRYFDVYYGTWSTPSRSAFIRSEYQFEELLEDILKAQQERRQDTGQHAMNQKPGQQQEDARSAVHTHVHAYSFCVSPAVMLHEILRVAFTSRVRFKTQALMKKYPFKEGALDSEFLVGRYEAFTHFMLRGRERTLPAQRQGKPTKRWHSDTAMGPDGPFNGLQDCECIEGVYICRDHRVQYFWLDTINGEDYLRVQSRYERRYGLEGEVFEYLAADDISMD